MTHKNTNNTAPSVTYIHNVVPIRERRKDPQITEAALYLVENGDVAAEPPVIEWLKHTLQDELAALRGQRSAPPGDLIA